MPEQTYDYLIAPKASFDATADAIRAMTGSQASITWGQDGFADAANNLGVDILQGDAPSGKVTIVATKDIPDQAICGRRGITDLIIDFRGGYTVTRTSIGGGNVSLINIQLIYADDNVREFAEYGISGANAVRTIVIRGYLSWLNQSGIRGNTGVTTIDFEKLGTIANNATFYGDSSLNTLIFRRTDTITAIAGTSTTIFQNTPFASGKAGGTLYVPASLVTDYANSTNWSTILALNANNQIKSIESTHTDPNAPIDLTLYYADGTLIPTT